MSLATVSRLFSLSLLACACASSSSATGGNGVADVGVRFDTPAGWRSATPDVSTPDALVVLIGPHVEGQLLAPTIEISKRRLSIRDQRRPPAHILTAMATELMQTFSSMTIIGEPEEVDIAGQRGARLQFDFSEMIGIEQTVPRRGVFVGLVKDGALYLIRSMVPTDGSQDAVVANFLKSLRV